MLAPFISLIAFASRIEGNMGAVFGDVVLLFPFPNPLGMVLPWAVSSYDGPFHAGPPRETLESSRETGAAS